MSPNREAAARTLGADSRPPLDGAGAEVVIESLAAGGDAVGHLADGMTVFVPRAVPGDVLRLRHVRRRRRHARAEVAQLIAPGPDRVAPRCPHFTQDLCGGCQWQHLSAEAQAAAKRRIVGDALRRIGGLPVPDPGLVASPREFGYRATITLTVRQTARGPVVGFHRADQGARVFPLRRCEIARQELNALWTAIEPVRSALPTGRDVRLKLRVLPDGGLHLIVSGGDGAWTSPEPLAEAASAAGLSATVWWEPRGGAVRVMAGTAHQSGAVAFEQVNPEVAALLRQAVLDAASQAPGRVLDLYAGAGDMALLLAERGHEVVAVEADERATRRAEERARAAGLPVRVVAARVEEVLASLLPADAVIVNPPRGGLAEEVTARLAQAMPHRLIYVSCDPATLARDLKRLQVAPPQLIELRAFDMFPQTSQVETLAVVAGREGHLPPDRPIACPPPP